MNDWKETLARLGEELPKGEEEQTTLPEEKRTTKKGSVRVSIDRKMRRGKTATLIEGFECPDEDVAETASELKRKLGTGGSCRGGDILIQGDRRNDIVSLLKDMGYDVKMC